MEIALPGLFNWKKKPCDKFLCINHFHKEKTKKNKKKISGHGLGMRSGLRLFWILIGQKKLIVSL